MIVQTTDLTFELLDYIPQIAVEEAQAVLTAKLGFSVKDMQEGVTDAQIEEELGVDGYAEYATADKDKKDDIRRRVHSQILESRVADEKITAADMARSNKVKLAYIIEAIKKGDDVVWADNGDIDDCIRILGRMRSRDYDKLLRKLEELDNAEEDVGKDSGGE